MKEGRIVAVCTSNKTGIPKYWREYVRIAHYGFAGDYHAKKMRRSFSTGGQKPNTDRHISIVAQEVIDNVNAELDLSLVPGSLGENITTIGLGDLSDIPDGTIIFAGAYAGMHVLLRVSEQNNPCSILQPLHQHMVKKLYGRRGLLCSILGSFNEVLRPNDAIIVTDHITHPPKF